MFPAQCLQAVANEYKSTSPIVSLLLTSLNMREDGFSLLFSRVDGPVLKSIRTELRLTVGRCCRRCSLSMREDIATW